MELFFYDDDAFRRHRAPRSIFLAGPTHRGTVRTPWRARALVLLEQRKFGGAVIVPEFRSTSFDDSVSLRFGTGPSPIPHLRNASHKILQWETTGQEESTVLLFWMPFGIGDPALPGLTTRAEVSRALALTPRRVVLGMPPGAESGAHIRYHASQRSIPVYETLSETVDAAVRLAMTAPEA